MKDFELMFAPMENHSDAALRELCYKNGADSTFTEMAMISALARGNKSAWARIHIPIPIPTYIQLSGANIEELTRFLKKYKPQEGFLGFNLNLGCPSPELIKKGLGCAMMKRTTKIQNMVSVFQEFGYSISLKIRLGLNSFEKKKKTYLNLIKEVDADFFVIHARHGKETQKEPADFSVYPECVDTQKIIIANGDIATREQITHLRSIGLRGAMIGRAASYDPTIFSMLKK